MSASLTQGQRLAREAAEAAEVRDWQDHPDVVALRVERIRTRIDRMMWAGIVIGLLFTMTSVQQFAAHAMNVGPGTLGWWAAWLLDPTVAIVLLGILLAERVVAPAQMLLGYRARVAKWGLLAATYVMNTWQSYAAGSPAGIVLHSVPVLAVFAAAESVTDCQDKLTTYVQWARTAAAERARRKTDAERERQGAVDAEQKAEHDRVARERADETRRLEVAAAEARATREHETRQAVATVSSVLALGAAWRSRPRTAPAVTPAPRPRTTTKKTTGRDRGRTTTTDVDVLVRHAQPILADEPDLGRRELANRLSAELRADVAPYWAQKAKDEIRQQRPLHAVGGTS